MPMKKVLGLCEMAALPFVNHAYNATTLTLTAHMHVMSTSTVCFLALQGHPDYLADDYVTQPLDYSEGTMGINELPGLGLELDPHKVARFQAAFDQDGASTAYQRAREGEIITFPAY
jgi:L-alanine-DL-glutamate epimerase-like enolase superfamily enzyme